MANKRQDTLVRVHRRPTGLIILLALAIAVAAGAGTLGARHLVQGLSKDDSAVVPIKSEGADGTPKEGTADSRAGAFPTPATTGWQHTGAVLSAYDGPATIDKDGTVIDGKDVSTCLVIVANNVTIRNSRIACASATSAISGTMIVQQADYRAPDVRGLTISDTEITRPVGSSGGADYGILLYGADVTLTRVTIHNVTSGVHLSGNGVTITDSYIGGLVNISGHDHIDGVISNGGVSHVIMSHNTIEVPDAQTTPIAVFPETEPNSYWLIHDNLIAGGGYCIYPSYSKGKESPNDHIEVTNNVFGKQFYPSCGANGPAAGGPGGGAFLDGEGNVWRANVWSDTGAEVLAP